MKCRFIYIYIYILSKSSIAIVLPNGFRTTERGLVSDPIFDFFPSLIVFATNSQYQRDYSNSIFCIFCVDAQRKSYQNLFKSFIEKWLPHLYSWGSELLLSGFSCNNSGWRFLWKSIYGWLYNSVKQHVVENCEGKESNSYEREKRSWKFLSCFLCLISWKIHIRSCNQLKKVLVTYDIHIPLNSLIVIA